MSRPGAAPRAAVPVSNARAEASRRNGTKSRGPKTAEGKARSAQNALKHGLRAERHVVLADEDAAEFANLEAALVEELAPVGVLQTVLAHRVAVAAWRLARADRIEIDLFAEKSWADAGPGLAMIRDGNDTRSFETLLRYRGAAMAEFWRALRTLKALQAERAAGAQVLETPPRQARAPAPVTSRPTPNEPERRALHEHVIPDQSRSGRPRHEPAAFRMPNEPEPVGRHSAAPASGPRGLKPEEPDRAAGISTDQAGGAPNQSERAPSKRMCSPPGPAALSMNQCANGRMNR